MSPSYAVSESLAADSLAESSAVAEYRCIALRSRMPLRAVFSTPGHTLRSQLDLFYTSIAIPCRLLASYSFGASW
jgi:hypothetical protein